MHAMGYLGLKCIALRLPAMSLLSGSQSGRNRLAGRVQMRKWLFNAERLITDVAGPLIAS